MMLTDLFSSVKAAKIVGDPATVVHGLSMDSRTVRKGDLFVALRGGKADGRSFASDALARGAAAILYESDSSGGTAPYVVLPEVRKHLGELASRIYGNPSGQMLVVGVTGTNGKTTTCHLIEAILASAGVRPGYIGTTAYRWAGKEIPAPRTTPEAADLHRLLREMLDGGAKSVVMECSSHGLELGRLSGLEADIGLFTNLTQDHLDFHGTMEKYAAAKRKLFDTILGSSSKAKRTAVLNVDDPVGERWSREISVPTVTFSASGRPADVRVTENELGAGGIRARLNVFGRDVTLASPLVGFHNLANLAAAYAVGTALGYEDRVMGAGLTSVTGVPGRLERVANPNGVHVFVDYAHTHDALENVIRALVPLRSQRLIVVFGCGGDRDRTKRPKMARVTASLADVTILTSDNPRSEDAEAILDEIAAGLPSEVELQDRKNLSPASKKVAARLADRREAIDLALEIATPGDIVLVAGKGHETTQEIRGVFHPFDDREAARR